VNVGGRNAVPMDGLRALCVRLGYGDVRTYVQSGNVVLTGAGKPAAVEARLEAALAKAFGVETAVMVRTATRWAGYLDCPFAEAAAGEPSRVLLGLSKAPLAKGSVEALRARAGPGEHVDGGGDALWFHYEHGVGRAKLSPALIDRLAGSPVTARNVNTVRKLAELAGVER
jgi:uncharacterized protein (DUF1697 family)